MKKLFKSLISVILAIVMLVCSSSIALAAEKVTPVVFVHGMGSTPLYKDLGTKNVKKVPNIDFGVFTANDNYILNQLLDAVKGNVSNVDKFIDDAASVMQGFTDIACDKNGNSLYDVRNRNYWTDSMAHHKDYLETKNANEPALVKQICDRIGADNVYCFNYDWRLDFVETADKLNSLIDIVKAEKGVEKVRLIGGSEGTCIIASYVDKYMYKDDIERIVYLDGAITGVSAAGAFAQDLYFDASYLQKYLVELTKTYNNRAINMQKLAPVAPALAKPINNLCNLVNKVLKNKKQTTKFYNEVLYPVFGNIPAMWGYIPYDMFDTAVAKMSAIGFLDKNSGLYTKITAYHKIQGRAASNIKALQAKGVEVAVVASYGTPSMPITSGYKNQSDILIDTKYASVGGTIADYGKILPASKVQKNKYASPDEIVDASTCATKDSTWFVKDVQHMNFWYGTQACDFIAILTTTNAPLTIDGIKAETGIGQFVGTDNAQNIVEIKTKASAPSLKLTTTKKTINATVGAVQNAKGYEIQYSTDKNFKSGVKTVKLTKNGTKTIKSLKSGKVYYVRTRCYKVVNGKTTYSKYATKSIKVK